MCVRAYAAEGRHGEKKSWGIVFSFRFASRRIPRSQFSISRFIIYKPAPAKTRHSTAPGPEVFAHCAADFRRPQRAPPKTAIYLHVFFSFLFVILVSYTRRISGRDDYYDDRQVYIYIGVATTLCRRRRINPHVRYHRVFTHLLPTNIILSYMHVHIVIVIIVFIIVPIYLAATVSDIASHYIIVIVYLRPLHYTVFVFSSAGIHITITSRPGEAATAIAYTVTCTRVMRVTRLTDLRLENSNQRIMASMYTHEQTSRTA